MLQEDILENLEYQDGHLLNRTLLDIPDNRWVKISSPSYDLLQYLPLTGLFNLDANWHRQGHAGMAFDTKRKSLLIFGSDSHGDNWDNSVHEFNLLTLQWTEHYPPSPKETYRADKYYNAIAGENSLFPWAMHTYDSVAYIPEIDALVVTSKFDHTPRPTELAKKAQNNPTWIYQLENRQWKILGQKQVPSFFAAGSTYDPYRSILWAYKHAKLWQFDIATQLWRQTPGKHKTDLGIHFTITTDTQRHQLVFFGNKSNTVWTYTPGLMPDQTGEWENKQPGGDICPKDEHFPVAYDTHQGVFLLVPDEDENTSITLVYSPIDNKYTQIWEANTPATGMNYMLAYDPYHRLFLLVTGDWGSPVTVWALRLNMRQLPPPAK